MIIDYLVTFKHANIIFFRQKNGPKFRILFNICFVVVVGGNQLPEKVLMRFVLLRFPASLLK